MLTAPLLSATLYTLEIVSGQVWLSLVWLTSWKLEALMPLLSVAEPPAAINSVNVAYAGGTCSIHCTLMVGGQFTTGGSLSITVTVISQEATLPQASVAVHTTVVIPNG